LNNFRFANPSKPISEQYPGRKHLEKVQKIGKTRRQTIPENPASECTANRLFHGGEQCHVDVQGWAGLCCWQ